jgi:hypothetical protein
MARCEMLGLEWHLGYRRPRDGKKKTGVRRVY